jgi:hypothetical protein
MFQESDAEGMAPAPFTLPTYRQETLRHILRGDHAALIEAINQMASLGYAIASPGQTLYPRAAAANTSAS